MHPWHWHVRARATQRMPRAPDVGWRDYSVVCTACDSMDRFECIVDVGCVWWLTRQGHADRGRALRATATSRARVHRVRLASTHIRTAQNGHMEIYHVCMATGCYYRVRHSPWRAMCRQPALARSGALHPALLEGVDAATTINSRNYMRWAQKGIQLTKRAETATRLGRKSSASARPACKPSQVPDATHGQLLSCMR